ncbi:MAG: hypothetical protein ABW174_00090 [Flavitalea sp.]
MKIVSLPFKISNDDPELRIELLVMHSGSAHGSHDEMVSDNRIKAKNLFVRLFIS